jgi:division protein CdvB (Snf7/Vps24/ESCRT-III family)
MLDKIKSYDDNFLRRLFTPFSHKDSRKLKDKINDVVFKIREHETKLEELISQMRRRGKDLFDAVVRAQREGDSGRAAIYAQEVAEIRKIVNVLTTAKLVLEKARLRLETVRDLAEAGAVLPALVGAFRAIRDEVKPIAPQIAIGLDALMNHVNVMAAETSALNGLASNYSPTITEDAKKILDEAKRESNEKLKTEFPELSPSALLGLPMPPKAETFAQSALQNQAKAVDSRKLSEIVLEYILQNNGVIEIPYVAKRLGVSEEDVYNALMELARSGKIALEA